MISCKSLINQLTTKAETRFLTFAVQKKSDTKIMADLTHFDPDSVGNPNYGIFGLPFTEEDAKLILLPVPWEVTVSYKAGTARATERICKASLQVDLMDDDLEEGWKQGIFLRDVDKNVLGKSDYLRKEAELYINYITEGDALSENKFMQKVLREINEGSEFLNQWVYDETKELLNKGKLVQFFLINEFFLKIFTHLLHFSS